MRKKKKKTKKSRRGWEDERMSEDGEWQTAIDVHPTASKGPESMY